MRGSEAEFPGAARHSLLLLVLVLQSAACAGARRGQPGLIEGLVLRVDRAAASMLVSHQATAQMPAMVMSLRVGRAGDLFERLKPGSRIRFELKAGEARRVSVIDSRQADDFRFPELPEELPVGAVVPDFSLVDQQGRAVTLASLRGRVVLVNFLYTRCPLPEVCPRLAASFASLQRRFGDRLRRDLMLVSITLDPAYDTPPVLARYAATMRADPDGWRFLTGETTPVARRFGLLHWAEEGVIVHNSQTAVVDRSGRLIAMVEGSTYRLEQLADLVRQALLNHEPKQQEEAPQP